jgi:hypothetical protein
MPPQPGAMPGQPSGFEQGAQQVGQQIEAGAQQVGQALDQGVQQVGQAFDQALSDVEGGEIFEDVKRYVRYGLETVKPHVISGAIVLGVITVPIAVLQIVFGFIPILGWLFALILGLAQLAAWPLAMAAIGRWALAVVTGQPITPQQAWKATLSRAASDWPNVVVFGLVTGVGFALLIVPGILLGAFGLQIYLVEKKSFVNVNMRNLDLVKGDWIRVFVVGLCLALCAIPVGIAVGILSAIFGFIPFVGAILITLLGALVAPAVAPFILIAFTRFYMDFRKRHEGVEVEDEARAQVEEWGGEEADEAMQPMMPAQPEAGAPWQAVPTDAAQPPGAPPPQPPPQAAPPAGFPPQAAPPGAPPPQAAPPAGFPPQAAPPGAPSPETAPTQPAPPSTPQPGGWRPPGGTPPPEQPPS